MRSLFSKPLTGEAAPEGTGAGTQLGAWPAPCAASEAVPFICVVKTRTDQIVQKSASSAGVTTDRPGVGLALCLTCGPQLPTATRASAQTPVPPRPTP